MTTPATQPHIAGTPGYTALLPCVPESVSRARALLSYALDAWGIDGLIDSGEVIVSELMTNAVDHTASSLAKVVIERHEDSCVRIEVADSSHAVPYLKKAENEAECGRGMLLVDALSWRWGCDRNHWGKVTWAELKEPAGRSQ